MGRWPGSSMENPGNAGDLVAGDLPGFRYRRGGSSTLSGWATCPRDSMENPGNAGDLVAGDLPGFRDHRGGSSTLSGWATCPRDSMENPGNAGDRPRYGPPTPACWCRRRSAWPRWELRSGIRGTSWWWDRVALRRGSGGPSAHSSARSRKRKSPARSAGIPPRH